MQFAFRLDRLINKLCAIRNELSTNFEVELDINETLGNVEEAIENLSQEIDQELK